jgi:hypothetical protein
VLDGCTLLYVVQPPGLQKKIFNRTSRMDRMDMGIDKNASVTIIVTNPLRQEPKTA